MERTEPYDTATESTGEMFLAWFEATAGKPYLGSAPLSHPALRISSAELAHTIPLAGWPTAESKVAADKDVDCEYDLEVGIDDGRTYGPDSYPTQFLARQREAEREANPPTPTPVDLAQAMADFDVKLVALNDAAARLRIAAS